MTSVCPIHRSVSEGDLGKYSLFVLTMKTSKACGSNPLRTVAIYVLNQVLFTSGCHSSWISIATRVAEPMLFFKLIFLCQVVYIYMALSVRNSMLEFFNLQGGDCLDAVYVICE